MAALAPFTEIPGRCNWMKHLFPDCDSLNDRQHPFGYQMTADDTHTLSGLTSSAMQGLSLGRL